MPSLPLLLTAAGFTLYTTIYGLSGLLPWMGEPATGIYTLSIALAGPVLVVLSASVRRETLLAGCLMLLSMCDLIACLISGLAPHSPVLLFTRLTTALLHPVLYPAALVISVKSVPARHKQYAVGSAIVGILAGVIACWAVLRWEASTLAHPQLLLVNAVLHAVAACVFYQRKEEKCRKKSSSYRTPAILSTSAPRKAKSL